MEVTNFIIQDKKGIEKKYIFFSSGFIFVSFLKLVGANGNRKVPTLHFFRVDISFITTTPAAKI